MLKEMEAAIAAPETQPRRPAARAAARAAVEDVRRHARAARRRRSRSRPARSTRSSGQNGSGKSTLIKTLAGYHAPDPGAVAWLDGEPFDLSAVGDRHDRLRFVHQDLGLVIELSADRQPRAQPRVRPHAARVDRLGRAGADRAGAASSGSASTSTCTGRCRTPPRSSARSWPSPPPCRAGTAAGVLVLDEPTAVLPPTEVERLFDIVREVRRGGTSVLYVSHRMDEIFEIADRVTVLRGGRVDRHARRRRPDPAGARDDDGRRGRRPARRRRRGAEPARPPRSRCATCAPASCAASSFALARGRGARHRRPARLGPRDAALRAGRRLAGRGERRLRLPAQSDAWIDLAEDARRASPSCPADRTTRGRHRRVQRRGEPDAAAARPAARPGRARPAARVRPRRRLDRPPRDPHRGLRRPDHDAQRRQPAEGRHGPLPGARLAGPGAVRADRGRRHRHADAALRPRSPSRPATASA